MWDNTEAHCKCILLYKFTCSHQELQGQGFTPEKSLLIVKKKAIVGQSSFCGVKAEIDHNCRCEGSVNVEI